MTLPALIITVVTFFVAAMLLIHTVIHYRRLVASSVSQVRTWADLPSQFDFQDLGRIEGNLPGLARVIVVAHKVEKPIDELSAAVENNFRSGVSYLFLVSKSRAEIELSGYYQLFEALARIARPGSDVHEIVDIKHLPHEWLEAPHVFYQMRSPSGNTITVAVRGLEVLGGIAKTYEPLDNASARALAQAILAEAPARIHVEPSDFEAPAGTIKLPLKRALTSAIPGVEEDKAQA